MNRQPIIVSGYPKSGNTWFTRLLADVLNCPAGSSHPSEDQKEIASEGWNRPAPYVVRKGHYRLDYNRQLLAADNNPIPYAHVLIPDRLTSERLIFVVRDPRDIIVSACHHWKRKSRQEVIDLVCFGGLAKLPGWNTYLEQWQQIKNVKWTSYESLSNNPLNEVLSLLAGLDYDKARLLPAIGRQEFDQRTKQIELDGGNLYLGKAYNLRFMRKGIIGDYKNFLTDKEQEQIWDRLGGMMIRMGYG